MNIAKTLNSVKHTILDSLKSTKAGNDIFYRVKHILGKSHIPDVVFPELISLELSSKCNLTCVHCPPHIKELSDDIRKHSHMEPDMFYRLMDEIDQHGEREIALHKDGESLLHPDIINILKRVKRNVNHTVYITTNGHRLNKEIVDTILTSKIDVINFSIGASSEQFYTKVRGKNFQRVMQNVHNYLRSVADSDWKPKTIVQIIDLPEYADMKEEISRFKEYWSGYDVEVSVWKKLTWGVLEGEVQFNFRYPCYSLWHSFNVNSNGIVTACCMDWKQELIVGSANENSIAEIWCGTNLQKLRELHIEGKENSLAACKTCNYWKWQPKLMNYPK